LWVYLASSEFGSLKHDPQENAGGSP
jgi:hypothetical protein